MKFLLENSKIRKLSDSTQNQAVNSLKFYYEKVLGQQRTFYELRPRKSRQLPGVFSESEVQGLFSVIANPKHRAILMLIYSSGLRIGESIRMRKADVNFDRKTVFVKAGKGKKDRYSVLSEKMKVVLRDYLEAYQPDYWLFEGQGGANIVQVASVRYPDELFLKQEPIPIPRYIPCGIVSPRTYLNVVWICDTFKSF